MSGGHGKITRIDLDDIKEFRKRNYVEVIDTLSDLNPKSANVTAIIERIQKLEKDCNDVLLIVPDNGNACFIKIKYNLAAILNRVKEFCDQCIAQNLNDTNPLELNVSEYFFFYLKNFYWNTHDLCFRMINTNVWMKF